MHELPLIVFTTLIQMSIGCVLFSAIYFLSQSTANIRLPMWFGFILGGIGGIASMAHLGNPWNVLNTVNNIGSSWMSREVVFVGTYLGLIALNVINCIFTSKFNRTLLCVTAIVGLVTIFVMSNIYVNSLFTLWTGIVTYSLFSATALLAGGAVAYTTLRGQTNPPAKQFIAFALIGLALSVVALVYLQNHLADNATTAMTAKYIDVNLVTMLSWGKFALSAVGVGLMAKFAKTHSVATLACLLMIIAELIGRIAYFNLGA